MHLVQTQQMPPLPSAGSAELFLLQLRAGSVLLSAPLASCLPSCPVAAHRGVRPSCCVSPTQHFTASMLQGPALASVTGKSSVDLETTQT